MSSLARKQIFLCLCGPGGCGKSTIARELITTDPALRLSISTTTRSPRGQEKDGEHYFFVSDEQFAAKVKEGAFIEHAVFNGKGYGTEKRNVHSAEAGKQDLVLDIDYQGAQQMKQLYPWQTIVLFVFPPSLEILEKRIRSRNTETEEGVQRRLLLAANECAQLANPALTDYLIINDELEQAVAAVKGLLSAERLRLARLEQTELQKLFSSKGSLE